MTEYITASDVQNRLTPAGYNYVADRDQSGTGVTSDEETKYVTPAIKYAGGLIDEAISPFIESVSTARNASNQWLKDRCLDIAAAMAVRLGGNEIPTSLLTLEERALKKLEDVRTHKIRVPELTYGKPQKISGNRSAMGPHMRNV